MNRTMLAMALAASFAASPVQASFDPVQCRSAMTRWAEIIQYSLDRAEDATSVCKFSGDLLPATTACVAYTKATNAGGVCQIDEASLSAMALMLRLDTACKTLVLERAKAVIECVKSRY